MNWAEIDPADDLKIAIGCTLTDNFLAEQVPGCNFQKARGYWTAPKSWASYVIIRLLFPSISYGPAITAWAAAAYAGVEQSWAMRQSLDTVIPEHAARLDELDAGRPPGRRLFTHQRGGASWLAWVQRGLCGDPQGNGKTPQVIRALQLSGQSALPALVICTPAAVINWGREFADWAPELRVQLVMGGAAKRRKAILSYHDEEGSRPPDVMVMAWPSVRLHTRLAPYPSLAFKRCVAHGGASPKITAATCEVHDKELNDIQWGTVVVDEAHRMQDAKTAQTRAVWWLMANARARWPVTGTPVADNIGSLWAIGHGMDPASFPAKGKYLDLFAIRAYNFRGGAEIQSIRPDTEHVLQSFVQPMIRRIPREIALPFLPPRMPMKFRYPEMSPPQARLYKQLRDQALAVMPDGTVFIPDNGLVKFTRMCQLASSMIKVTETQGADPEDWDQQVALTSPSGKVDDLAEFIRDDGDAPLVVCANSPALLRLAQDRLESLKIRCSLLAGKSDGMTSQGQQDAIDAFQAGKVQVILVSIRAGGESITLTRSNTVFFLQPTPSYLQRDQMIGRVDRIGSQVHDSIRLITSITADSVEQRLYSLGDDKEERSGQITRDPDLLRWVIRSGDGSDDTSIPQAAGHEG